MTHDKGRPSSVTRLSNARGCTIGGSVGVCVARTPLMPNGKLGQDALPPAWTLEKLGIHDDFLAFGFHSMRMIPVLLHIRHCTGLDVDMTQMPNGKTVSKPAPVARSAQ
jgi:hypothetical protein